MTDPVLARLADTSVDHRTSLASAENRRLNALHRLYARRDAVDALIRSFEIYEQTGRRGPARCTSVSGERKCS